MPNRLANETSPYLLQHAENPVDWYPWGPEALDRAKTEGKPILLSIGYAACHWCHVMERESFTNPDIARLMNLWYVPIKVDREERPDLDGIYMDAVQAMTGHGGWPMTVFLTPEGKPFYGGTYYPPEDRRGMPGFPRVLEAVHDAWLHKREDITKQADALTAHISGALTAAHGREHDLTDVTLRAAAASLRGAFDPEWGGFGSAPKFPQPPTIEALLRLHARGEADALAMATATLERMARGGIFDQVGGGFHRYSTDREWLVPHFEKMLYDNGQLLRAYTRAWLITRDPLFRRTALATAEYLLREMRHPDGGFFSSQDADSEGVEGKSYVWSSDEFAEVAGEDAEVAARYLGVSAGGNWEGANIVWVPRDEGVVAEELGTTTDELLARIDRARTRLLQRRSLRVAPATDDKILASWNGLAISGLCEAGRVFARPDLIDAAAAAAAFVLRELRDASGRLLRSWRDGRTSVGAFLDDHALMAGACLDLYETTFDESWFAEAQRLADDVSALFADPDGGFFDTGSDAENLLIRPKDVFDNAMPCGNSAMAETTLRLAALRGDPMAASNAEPMLRLLQPAVASSPNGFGTWLGVLDLVLTPAKEIAVTGPLTDPSTRALIDVVWNRYLPSRVLAAGDPEATTVPLLKDRVPLEGKPAAYVCEGFVCLRPVAEPEDLARELGV